MGIRPLRDDQILIGKATGDAEDTEAITAVAPAFAGKAPLWTYILAEATANAFNVHDGHIIGKQFAPIRLGPVGGRIVAEVFVGLMAVDRTSVLYEPAFRPESALTKMASSGSANIPRTAATAAGRRSRTWCRSASRW